MRVLRPGSVLAIDDVRSHGDEVAPFLELLAREPALVGSTIGIGKGLHLTWYRGHSCAVCTEQAPVP